MLGEPSPDFLPDSFDEYIDDSLLLKCHVNLVQISSQIHLMNNDKYIDDSLQTVFAIISWRTGAK